MTTLHMLVGFMRTKMAAGMVGRVGVGPLLYIQIGLLSSCIAKSMPLQGEIVKERRSGVHGMVRNNPQLQS